MTRVDWLLLVAGVGVAAWAIYYWRTTDPKYDTRNQVATFLNLPPPDSVPLGTTSADGRWVTTLRSRQGGAMWTPIDMGGGLLGVKA